MIFSRFIRHFGIGFFLVWALASGYAQAFAPSKLEPTKAQRIASVNIIQILRRNHYGKVHLDNTASQQLFDNYINDLDANHSFFLASDIKALDHYREHLDTALRTGNLNPAFDIYARYQLRVQQRLSYMISLLNPTLSKLDFTKVESLQLDRTQVPWIITNQAMNHLWKKRLKDSVLRLRASGKSDKDIAQLLKKRYHTQLKRLQQTRSEDVFQEYMNAFTAIYDPHTKYFSPRSAENFDINMSLSLEGIGAVLQEVDKSIKVIRLIPGGPAMKANQLKPGDRIIGIAQGDVQHNKKLPFTDVIGWRIDSVVALIRGQKGTKVSLEVTSGDNSGMTHRYTITRDKVKIEGQSAKKSLLTYQRDGRKYRIGIITLPVFYMDFRGAQEGLPDYRSSTRDVHKLLQELQKEKIDGLIVDLRNNGGGSLQEANQMIGLFAPAGSPTVQIKDYRGMISAQKDPDSEPIYTKPMLVLVNRLSASASEIFAGAMQDYGRALIVGSQTFGKGTVQSIQPLNHGQLKLTLAKFYRISGESTQNRGVHPNILYPELFDPDDIGESALPNAMPWDKIRPTTYTPFGGFKSYLKALKSCDQARVSKNPYFAYLHQEKAFINQQGQRETITLNAVKREALQKKIHKEQLALANQLRTIDGKKTFKSIKQLEQAQKDQDANPDAKVQPESDALLVESGEVLLDYLQMRQHKTFNQCSMNASVVR